MVQIQTYEGDLGLLSEVDRTFASSPVYRPSESQTDSLSNSADYFAKVTGELARIGFDEHTALAEQILDARRPSRAPEYPYFRKFFLFKGMGEDAPDHTDIEGVRLTDIVVGGFAHGESVMAVTALHRLLDSRTNDHGVLHGIMDEVKKARNIESATQRAGQGALGPMSLNGDRELTRSYTETIAASSRRENGLYIADVVLRQHISLKGSKQGHMGARPDRYELPNSPVVRRPTIGVGVSVSI